MAFLNASAFLNTVTTQSWSIPIAILYVTVGCNLKCVMCSYREPLPGEHSLEEISDLARRLNARGLQRIVYSGGEPLLRKDFPQICRAFQRYGVQQTLLTNGLLLEKRHTEIEEFIDEYIISLDGPTAAVHDSIRGVQCFDQIANGIRKVVLSSGENRVLARYVVQRRNYQHVEHMVDFAKNAGFQQVSFLAVDVESDAFGKNRNGSTKSDDSVLLTTSDVVEFRRIMNLLISSRHAGFANGFIAQSPGQLLHIVQYFEARAGVASFPVNRCNAPSMSAVITSTGEVKPCFFLPAFGNIRETPLEELLNLDSIRRTRGDVRSKRVDRCKTCVCTLRVDPLKAMLNRF